MDHRSRKRIREVKRKARPELGNKGDWTCLAIAENFEPFKTVVDNVERIQVKDVPPNEFIDKYESTYKPVVICGVQDSWKATYKWTMEVKQTNYYTS
ncbi:unnamed protein product, partial [Timema podura]|nr:unnamed protein product [Timema podura]